jgi:hypothetical protein
MLTVFGSIGHGRGPDTAANEVARPRARHYGESVISDFKRVRATRA